MRSLRGLGALVAAAGLLAILVLTLLPNPRQAVMSAHTPLLCVVCGESGSVDFFLNLLLFLPLSAGLAMLGWPWGRVVFACALLSFGVEAAQYLVVTGRDASLSDLISNTASGALGAALGPRLRLLLAPAPALARRLSLAAIAAWLGLVAFTALAMRPWAPAGQLRNYCGPVYPTGEIFAGSARAMTLNGVALACDQDVPHSREIRRELRAGVVQLETVADVAVPDGGRKVIHLVRTPDAALVMLTQHGRGATFQAPTAAQAVRLLPPVLGHPRAFPASGPGATTLVGEILPGRRMRLTSSHDGGRGTAELALSPSYGWTLLFGAALRPGRGLRLAAAVWLAALILPAAYWAARSARPAGIFGVLGAAVIAGLGLVPGVGGFEPVHWSEWAGAAGGLALGRAGSGIAAYLQSRCGSPSTSAYSSS